MIYCSKAPLRIGLAGGGTDVSPFSDLYGGVVLNATVNLYARACIIPREDGKIILRSEDRNEVLALDTQLVLDVSDNLLRLQKGVYNHIASKIMHKPLSFELITSIDVPSGSGLGTSSTLVVAIIGAFLEWLNIPLGEYEIAQLAYTIEREELKMAGGKQDQYAATFGGINFIEFNKNNEVIVNPLRIKSEILRELEFHLLLFYTKVQRESSHIIETQTKNISQNVKQSLDATLQLKEQAYMMKDALLKGNLAAIGEILNYGWTSKKQMALGITNAQIDLVYQTAMENGASGGKISGAGGGGFITFYCPKGSRYMVSPALRKLGLDLYHYDFVQNGLSTWTSYQ